MIRRSVLLLSAVGLAACSTTRDGPRPVAAPHYKVGQPYQVNGKTYTPREEPEYEAVGVASWYGDAFDGKRTANGEIFDKDRLSAAHTTMPLPSLVEVENLENGRRVVVRVNDRGPFVGDRLIDLSHGAARALGFDRAGLARVRVRYLGRAELAELAPIYGSDRGTRVAVRTSPPVAPTPTRPASAQPLERRTVVSTAPVDTSPLPEASEDAPLMPSVSTAPTSLNTDPSIEMTPLEPIPGTLVRGEPQPIAEADSSSRAAPDAVETLLDGALQTQAPRPVRTEYWITVAQFFGLSELEGAMKKLSPFGGLRMVSDAGGVGYRLQLGPFADEASANARLAALREAGYPDVIIADERCYSSPTKSNLANC
jgi:rare lipoprotein A